MGRKKLQIKRIEDKNSRQVTFTKRRNGLMKKAKELTILCDLDLALLVFSARGKLYHFSSTSLTEIFQRYNRVGEEGESSKDIPGTEEKQEPRFANFMTVKQLLGIVERLDEPDGDQLSSTDFEHLELQMESALQETRARKVHLLMEDKTRLEQQEKKLIEENKVLQEELAMSRLQNRMQKTIKFL